MNNKPEKPEVSKTRKILDHAFNIFALGLAAVSLAGLVSAVAYTDRRADEASQSLQAYQDYKDGKIDYKTISYILGGHGVQPSGIDSALLMSIQTRNNDFAARDETLMSTMSGRYSFETTFALESVREVFDEDYRKEYNSKLKEKLTEQQYQDELSKQKTSLSSQELSSLKSCYTKLSEQSDLRKIIDIALDLDTRCTKPASEEADKSDIFKEKASKIDAILSEETGKQQP